MSSVNVLCPNGRRQTVKITQATKILQIIDEVCLKQSLQPASDYELIHSRKTLDPSLSVRYSGVPNLAKLELRKRQNVHTDSAVQICVQLSNGSRIVETFEPSTSLWQILLTCDKKQKMIDKSNIIEEHPEDGTQPVFVYMRDQFIGQFVQENTVLRDLGLSGGKATLRFNYQSISSSIIEKQNEDIKLQILKQKKLASFAERTKNESILTTAHPSNSLSSNQRLDHQIDPTNQSAEADDQTPQATPMEIQVSSEPTEQETQNSHITESFAVNHSDSSTNSHILLPETHSIERSTKPSSHKELEENKNKDHIEERARRIAERLIPGINTYGSEDRQQMFQDLLYERRIAQEISLRNCSKAPNSNVHDFKFPEETKGKQLYKNELSDVKPEEYKPCTREAILYTLEEDSNFVENSGEISDDFFELNLSDIRGMLQDLRKKVKDSTDAPMMTSAMRKADQEFKYAKYKRVIIRFHFPHKTILQAVFRPYETVHALYKFVRNCLSNQELPFYLYTSPPKSVLDEQHSTLLEKNLVPMSVIYFGCEQETNYCDIFNSETQSLLQSRLTADKECNKHLPVDTERCEAQPSCSKVRESSELPPKRSTDSSVTSASKVPKWFKMGK